MFDIFQKSGIPIDKSKREKFENIAAVTESRSVNCRSQQLNISETSLRRILRNWYYAIQSPIGSGVEANWRSNAFSIL